MRREKWFSDDTRIAASIRDKVYTRAVSAGNEQDRLLFKVEKNRVVKIIRNKRKEYYE